LARKDLGIVSSRVFAYTPRMEATISPEISVSFNILTRRHKQKATVAFPPKGQILVLNFIAPVIKVIPHTEPSSSKTRGLVPNSTA